MDEATLNFFLGAGLTFLIFLISLIPGYLGRPKLKLKTVEEVRITGWDKMIILKRKDAGFSLMFYNDGGLFIGVDLSELEFKKLKEAINSFEDSPQKSMG